MRRFYVLLMALLFYSCSQTLNTSNTNNETHFKSESPTQFHLQLAADETSNQLLQEKTIYGKECAVSIVEKGGQAALAIKTNSEFSDAFIDLEKLFGHPIDFSKARYLSMQLYVPEDSWIATMKFNFRDSANNFGGFKEVFNNFYGHYDQWINVVVDVQDLLPDFRNWSGDENPLGSVTQFSFNPYNAHQEDSSVIYVNNIQLSDKKVEADYIPALMPRLDSLPNIPYKITFDQENLRRQHMAYRSYESSSQALAKGIGGNETMSIRIRGAEHLKHMAFLPMMDRLTGHPVDFTKVKRIYFSYYLTPESDDFNGSWLYIAGEHWQNLLIDKDFYRDFKKGSWEKISVDIADLNLERARGEDPVLSNVYEIRFDLQYFPGRKNVEMWIDDFGWE